MVKEVIVESFELDHTIVKAPLCTFDWRRNIQSDVISNFDIRLVQPNEDSIPTAGSLPQLTSPSKSSSGHSDWRYDWLLTFGCRTGFHIMWGRHSTTEIAKVIKAP